MEPIAGMSKPMIKPSHRGALHRALGVPVGTPLTAAQLTKAFNSSSPHMRQMANFARNFGRKKK